MIEADSVLRFKYRWVNDEGEVTGFFASKGYVDDQFLVFGKEKIYLEQVLSVATHEKFMSFVCLSDEGYVTLTAAIYKAAAKELKRNLDIKLSRNWAKAHRDKLAEEGREHDFRSQECHECGATLILTDLPETPQLYCHFCESLKTIDQSQLPPRDEASFCLCEECGLFSKPTKFTLFYFYFLFVIYGFSQSTTYRCPACMRPEAWKMLFGNLIFVLGVPVALVQLFRAYKGNTIGGDFSGLDSANIKIRKGNINGAIQTYSQIIDRVPYCAGIKYNLAQGLIRNGDFEHARQTLELALDDCSNYAPAYYSLCLCLEELGDHAALAALKKQWEDEEVEKESEFHDEFADDPIALDDSNPL